jgi:hypothetical protein
VLVLTRPQPRVLHDILGFAGAAEHAVRIENNRGRCASNVAPSQSIAAMVQVLLLLPLIFRRMTEAVCDTGVPRRRCHKTTSDSS